jgi:alcohol dehydrogenase class IV
MAGIAFTNTGVGVVHALAHTIGAKHCTHHGMTNAVILPYGMEFNLPEAAPQYAEMARYLKIGSPDLDELALAQALIKKIRDLMVEVNLPKSLKELGISDLDKGSIEDLGFHALTDPAIMFNIKDVAQEDLCSIIKRTC